MKSNRNFQKTKKSNSFDEEKELKVKKVGTGKKKKNFKKEIFAELDEEEEEFDLFGRDEDFEIDENSKN
ncbi:MAG: hypothetical protein KQH79_16265 [Bacteroidetes bacterium]|nr:hypothetical protein [Bacteroidota bacterium]